MSASFEHDLVIIGGGSAGLTAAKTASFFAKSVALIDRDSLGGDCLHFGCVPSKALIKASRIMHEVRTAERFGLELSSHDVALKAVNARVKAAIETVSAIDSIESMKKIGVEVLLGGARFEDPHTLIVGEDRRLRAKNVLICTGSRAIRPDIPGLAEAGFWTNEGAFDLEELPRTLVVIGGGPIGVEMAQAFRRLGSEVTILQRGPHLLPKDDRDVVEILEQTFDREGIELRFGAAVKSVGVEGTMKLLHLSSGATIRADAVMAAVGRRPNLEGLGLEKAGVRFSSRGILVNDRLQTSQPHVYAAGDVVGGLLFTHFAGYQAAHAVRNIFLPIKLKFEPGNVPWVTFTDPEIGHVGMTEEEAKASGQSCDVVKFPYALLDRAITDQEPSGLIKFLIDSRRRIIGCHVAGSSAGELINEVTLAMNNALTVDRIVTSIHAYPTYSFGIPIALYDYVLNEEPAAISKVGRFLSKLT
jgi:pyruvate/2-oxoglutarate dehydrogenase complex dihydrolipoamide dehydrogenase (E3) component